MISRRVMLFGGVVLVVSYVLAAERVGTAATGAHLANLDDSVPVLPTAPEPAHAPANNNQEVRALAAELARMKSELHDLRDDRQSERAAPERPEPAPKTPEQQQADHDEYITGVERAFEREPRDERWAQGTAQRLRTTLQSEPILVAAVRGIECRSRSCRLELRDDGSTAFAEEFPLMMHEMGALLPEVRFGHAELSDGARLHIMYMSQSSSAPADEL